jgi:6-phosphofructokinase 1
MAYEFVTNAIDALLRGEKKSVICHEAKGFNFKSIEEVTSKKKVLDVKLLSYL